MGDQVSSSREGARPEPPARTGGALRFEIGEAPAPPPPVREKLVALAGGLLVAAIAALVMLPGLAMVLVPAMLTAGGTTLLWRERRRTRPRPRPASERAIELSGQQLTLLAAYDAAPVLRLDLRDDVGLVLLSNRRRDRLVAVLSSPAGTFLFGAEVEVAERRASSLLSRASVIGGDEAALDATGPDGRPVVLPFPDFRALVAELEVRAPGCVGRLVLSDQHGGVLRLDAGELATRHGRIDLERPLEWRPLLFQESFGHAVSLYQGTWVRQGGVELVLVSILTPSFLEASAREQERAGVGELDVLAMRDQRLLQASAGDPPPVEQRVAVDGLFVVPIRTALEGAPRASVHASRARHA